jgi:hypothetical protein
MPFKDLPVTVDASREGRQRLAVADELAQRSGAHLVGWYRRLDGRRVASGAMNDALVLLETAESVTVLSIGADERAVPMTEAASAHLRRHGVATASSRTAPVCDMIY